MKLEFHPDAEMELVEAAVYYETEVPGLGERFEAEILRATSLLLKYSEAGTPVDPALRRFVLRRFPFTLYYSTVSEVLRVEAVAHHSRRPGYWKSRASR